MCPRHNRSGQLGRCLIWQSPLQLAGNQHDGCKTCRSAQIRALIAPSASEFGCSFEVLAMAQTMASSAMMISAPTCARPCAGRAVAAAPRIQTQRSAQTFKISKSAPFFSGRSRSNTACRAVGALHGFPAACAYGGRGC